MKVALVGFTMLPVPKYELIRLVTEYGHTVVEEPEANVLLIPHHRDDFFPKEKPWIAIWIQGGIARFTTFRNLENPPREIIFATDLAHLKEYQGKVLCETLSAIERE